MRRRMMFSDPEYKGYARERIEIELTNAKKELSLNDLAKDFANGGGESKLNSCGLLQVFQNNCYQDR